MPGKKRRRRASSRANSRCPHCNWLAHGAKGLRAHFLAVHGGTAPPDLEDTLKRAVENALGLATPAPVAEAPQAKPARKTRARRAPKTESAVQP